MYHYIQIDENGYVVSDSWLSGEVIADNMIRVVDNFNSTNKRYVDGEWIEYIPEVVTHPPTQLDVIEANTTYIAMMM